MAHLWSAFISRLAPLRQRRGAGDAPLLRCHACGRSVAAGRRLCGGWEHEVCRRAPEKPFFPPRSNRREASGACPCPRRGTEPRPAAVWQGLRDLGTGTPGAGPAPRSQEHLGSRIPCLEPRVGLGNTQAPQKMPPAPVTPSFPCAERGGHGHQAEGGVGVGVWPPRGQRPMRARPGEMR